jgi:opacity protein-like surface antigen/hemolysin activation/secretion protein
VENLRRKNISANSYNLTNIWQQLCRINWVIVVGCTTCTSSIAQEINPTQLQSEPSVRRRGPIRQLVTPEALLVKPKNAEKIYITIKQIYVNSEFTEFETDNKLFIDSILNTRISISDLYNRAIALQSVYNKQYPLVRLSFKYVPKPGQEVSLEVVDNEIDEIDLGKVPDQIKEQVYSRLVPLLHKRRLSIYDYQRQTLLIGTIAGTSGITDLRFSKNTNAYVLVPEIEEIPISASTTIDNRLPFQLGTFEASQSFGFSNRLGLGEQLSFSGSSSFDFSNYFSGTSKFAAYSGDLVVPVGADGLTAGAGFYSVRGRSTPLYGTFSGPVYDFIGQRYFGHYERASTHLQYPLLLTNDKSLKIQGLYDYIVNRTSTGPGALGIDNLSGYYFDAFRDRYSAARFTSEAKSIIPDWEWGGSIMALSIFSHGLGGRTVDWNVANNQLLSRPFTTPYFSKFGLKVKASLGLPQDFQLTLIGRSQTSFGQPLPITEMLSFDGYEAVSGYGAGTLNVDKGVTGRAELSHLVNLDVLDNRVSAAPYIFASYGRGQRSQPYIGEPPRLWAETFGGGVRADTNITGAPFGEYFAFEAGKNYSNIFYYTSGYRTNVSFNMRYAGDPGIKRYFEDQPEQTKHSDSDKHNTDAAWSGPYAGISSGYNWDPRSYVQTSGTIVDRGIDEYFNSAAQGWPLYADTNLAGLIGKSQSNSGGAVNGGQIGFNLADHNFLFGAEFDISGLTNRNRHDFWNTSYAVWPDGTYDTLISYVESQKNIDSLATFRGRSGYFFNDTFLTYLTAGLALGRTSGSTFISQQYTGEILGPLLSNTSSRASFNQEKAGWTAGAGIEWMFAPKMSLRAEYLYYDLGTKQYRGTPIVTSFQPTGEGTPTNVVMPFSRTQYVGDVVRVGLNYHPTSQLPNKMGKESATEYPGFLNGFYAGLNAGYGWNRKIGVINTAQPIFADLDNFGSFTPAILDSIDSNRNAVGRGVLGGGTFGYNHFYNRILLGAEADLQGSTLGFTNSYTKFGNVSLPGLDLGTVSTSVRNEAYIDWLGTGRIRLGINLLPSIVIYGTGGFAYGGATARSFYGLDASTMLPDILGSTAIGSDYRVKFGWAAGGGLEWLFSPNISLKGEYLVADIGKTSFNSNLVSVSAPYGDSPDISYFKTALIPNTKFHFVSKMARFGINYHFDLLKSLPKVVD